jgi:hypothetical protein
VTVKASRSLRLASYAARRSLTPSAGASLGGARTRTTRAGGGGLGGEAGRSGRGCHALPPALLAALPGLTSTKITSGRVTFATSAGGAACGSAACSAPSHHALGASAGALALKPDAAGEAAAAR